MTVDEGRSLAGQEHGSSDQFVNISPAGRRCPLFEPVRKFRAIDQRLIERGLEVTRRDRVDLETIWPNRRTCRGSGSSSRLPSSGRAIVFTNNPERSRDQTRVWPAASAR